MVWKTNFQAALTVAAGEVNLIGVGAGLPQRGGGCLRPLRGGLHRCCVPPGPTVFWVQTSFPQAATGNCNPEVLNLRVPRVSPDGSGKR